MGSFFDRMKQPIKLGDGYPWPNRFSIETSSYCNRSCTFCPIVNGTRPSQIHMSNDLYYKIVQELIDNDFDGVVQLFLLNEPTLDKTLKEKARLLRDCLPKITIYISTNGDTFSRPNTPIEESAARLVEWFDCGINVINLNTYDEGVEQYTRHQDLIDYGEMRDMWELTTKKYRKHSPRKRWLAWTDMRVNRPDGSVAITDMFYDRKNEDRKFGVPQVHCGRPHRHLVVRYDGIVPICCAIDPSPSNPDDLIVAGDLNSQTITEIWNSDIMNKYRWFLQQKRRELPACNTCTHRMSYSHVVHPLEVDNATAQRWEQEAREALHGRDHKVPPQTFSLDLPASS